MLAIVVDLKLDGKPLVMELDTGATVSLVSEQTSSSLFPGYSLKPAKDLPGRENWGVGTGGCRHVLRESTSKAPFSGSGLVATGYKPFDWTGGQSTM